MTDRPPPFALTPEERNSPLWQRLMGHFAERIQRLRAENDSQDNPPERTAAIRGEIAALKGLERLNTPRPAPEAA
jgi:hypothetical protein